MSLLSSQNLEVIRWVTSLLSPSKNMQFCNEQIRTQPLFSPPCASATYGSTRICRRKNWGQVTNICVSKLTNIVSDNGLSPGRRQAIIWTNAGILLIGPLGTIFYEILIKISTFPFTKTRLKVSSAKWWPFCLGLNVLNNAFKATTTTNLKTISQEIASGISKLDLTYIWL